MLRVLLRLAGTSVASIFLPTICDAAWSDGYVNAHIAAVEYAGAVDVLESIPPLRVPNINKRTRLHARFNDLLQEAATAAGLTFWNGFDPMFETDGIIDPAFLSAYNGTDMEQKARKTLL